MIYGLRAVMEAVEAGKSFNKVYLQKGLQGDLFQQLEGVLRKSGVSTSYVPPEKLNRLSPHNHQGAVGLMSPVNFENLEEVVAMALNDNRPALFLLLDQVSDVRNFGAIIRTAECTGANGIILAKSGNAPVNEDTIKTSAGAAFNIPLIKVDHLKDAVYYLQSSGIKVVGITEKATDTLYQQGLKDPVALIMGSEEKGIHPSLLKITDARGSLPLLGKIESLNVSVACGIALYEVIRQRLYDQTPGVQ